MLKLPMLALSIVLSYVGKVITPENPGRYRLCRMDSRLGLITTLYEGDNLAKLTRVAEKDRLSFSDQNGLSVTYDVTDFEIYCAHHTVARHSLAPLCC